MAVDLNLSMSLPLASLSLFFFLLRRSRLGDEVFFTPFSLNDRSDCGDRLTSFAETVEFVEFEEPTQNNTAW